MAEKLLLATMYALKTTVKDETTWHSLSKTLLQA
jgi:hypothetical protein